MSSHRTDRLANQLRQEISAMLQRSEIKDPRLGFVTIAGVRVSKDLSQAQVFISVFGSEDEAQKSIEALQKAQGFIRHELSHRLHIRKTPSILFKLDNSIEEGHRVTQLIEQLPEFQNQSPSQDDPVDEDGTP
ncbi:MAG: 30S ribosome-binding factor RbfA [Myxococcales bacterium]|nr:30S ribosome-binding factor RbfA [Myxococcales bacterium]MCB9643087.1 30S ribosome-binding factor RbfA [Myxococcales bacterium]